jgi:hypothetical protein
MIRLIQSPRSWLSLSAFAAGATLLALWFLSPSYVEFPMDDAYIHMVYAQNLAQQGRLAFSFAAEKGVGTSSILWVVLLAAGSRLGLSMPLVAKVLGAGSLAVVGSCLFLLLRRIWGPIPSFVAAWLAAFSGNMIWFALSGMETVLFVAAGLVSLLLYRERRWILLGVVLGVMTLIRPEGLALAAAIVGVEILGYRRLPRGLLFALVLSWVICGPWFVYLLWRTGHILPTSALGKQFTSAVAAEYLLGQAGAWSWVSRIPGLVYAGGWIGYLLLFALGGMTLPAPRIALGSIAGVLDTSLSAWALPAWLLVVGLLGRAWAGHGSPRKWRLWIQDPARRPLMALLLWVALHNLAYLIFLPVPGTASRYGAVNHVVVWLALAAGLFGFLRRPRLLVVLGCGLLALWGANISYWNGVYDANLDHMVAVRIEAARYVHDTMPPDEVCAGLDIGALRYFTGRPIVDLGGLVDPDIRYWHEQGSIDSYLVGQGTTCLVLPGCPGWEDKGWLDPLRMMGLSTSPLFRMKLVQEFHIDYLRWLQGYLPTTNYQCSVSIYRLIPAADGQGP